MPRWLRIATYIWPLFTALALWMLIDQFVGSTATTLVCDRPADTCTLSGGSQAKVPPPSRLAGATLRKQLVHKEGDAYYVTLVERAGTQQDIGPYAAFDDRAIASYQRSVDAINEFAKGGAPHLDTTFVYRASLHEKISTLLGAVLVLGIQAVLAVLWLRSRRRA